MAAKAGRPAGGTVSTPTRSRVQGGPPAQRPEIVIGRGQKGDPVERRARSIRDAILREEWETDSFGNVAPAHRLTRFEQRVTGKDEGTEVRQARAKVAATAPAGVRLATMLLDLAGSSIGERAEKGLALSKVNLDALCALAERIITQSGGKP